MPWALKDEYDPVQHPEAVMQDTRKWSVLTLLLEPWIQAGLIIYVPEQSDFNQKLRDAFLASGQRRQAEGKIYVHADDLKQHKQAFKGDFLRQLYSLSDDDIIKQMRGTIDLADEGVASTLAYINEERKRDPLFVPGVAMANPLMRIQAPTIDDTVLCCGLTGAFPFTDMRGRWREITEHIEALPPDAHTWSPLSRAFSECQLEFLNTTDPRLALEIREEQYLSSFRGFMRSLWKAIDGSPNEHEARTLARDMSDRLRDEYRKAMEEWRTIHAKYDSAVRRSAIASAFSGITVGLSGMGFVAVALSFVSHVFLSATHGKQTRRELANFRARIPMSIFIDVKG
jgi:hypothetical protein